MTDRIELLQIADLDESVVVGVVIGGGRREHHHLELLGRAPVGPVVGGRHRDDGIPFAQRSHRQPRPRTGDQDDTRVGRGHAVGNHVSLGVHERPRKLRHGRVTDEERPFRQVPHRHRRPVSARFHRDSRTACCLAAGDDRRDLVGVVFIDRHVGVGVRPHREVLRQGLDGAAVDAGHGVAHSRRRHPLAAYGHFGPGHHHLGRIGGPRRRSRSHGRTGPELVAELLPGRIVVSIHVDGKGRVLAGGAEVPGVVPIVVTVQIHVPGPVDAPVASGRLQLGGCPARTGRPGTMARRARIPVAGGDGPSLFVPHQSADIGISRRRTRGVAGADLAN